jgi:hypothetical protein
MRISVTIEGITPFLMNQFSSNDARLSGSPEEQAEAKAYRDESGVLAYPSQNIMACLLEAARGFSEKEAAAVPHAVEVEGLSASFNAKDYAIDSRSVILRIEGNRQRAMCYRPRLDNWRLTFILNIDHQQVKTVLVRQMIERAGKMIGLGDYRPQCKGPFGKFQLVDWNLLQPQHVTAAARA